MILKHRQTHEMVKVYTKELNERVYQFYIDSKGQEIDPVYDGDEWEAIDAINRIVSHRGMEAKLWFRTTGKPWQYAD